MSSESLHTNQHTDTHTFKFKNYVDNTVRRLHYSTGYQTKRARKTKKRGWDGMTPSLTDCGSVLTGIFHNPFSIFLTENVTSVTFCDIWCDICDIERSLKRTNGSNMGEPIRTRKGKLAGRVEHDARLYRVVQVKKKGGGNPLI